MERVMNRRPAEAGGIDQRLFIEKGAGGNFLIQDLPFEMNIGLVGQGLVFPGSVHLDPSPHAPGTRPITVSEIFQVIDH
jgi:hypothetical protein